ncbi:MAG: hypothetical protein IKH86_08795 [Prevotella sp.]|nr:hypothetical protein [Prevotella sp.]
MKKIFKSMLLFMAVTAGTGILASCNDEDLPAADGLFRPVINENDNIEHALDANNRPTMTIKWDNYTSANKYTVKIEANDGSDTREISTDTTFCVFDKLQYDKEYNVSLTAENTTSGLASKPFTLTTTSLDYPTALSTIGTSDVIDTQVRIRWNSEVETYDSLAIYTDSDEEFVIGASLSADDNVTKERIFKSLEPKTTYRVVAFLNGEYKGKKRFTTVAPENYTGVVFDLRDMDESESKNYINTDQLAADVAANPGENITYVLQGGQDYKISGGTVVPGTSKTITFVTGLTLAGNANFISSGGMGLAGEDVEGIVFEKINFKSDKLNNGDYTIATNQDKGFGGRQVFNINGVNCTLKNITFKSCSMQGYRAIVRAQQDGDNINNITLEDCIINGIGDQGCFTTTNKDSDWRTLTMKNCTVTNIVSLCDFRKTTNTLKFTIENCTFCYAPMETTANANTPLFRIGSENVELKVKNSIFGPAMATEESTGGKLLTYTAGTAGSIFVNGGTFANSDIMSSYKTNFSWIDMNTTGEGDPKVYPLEGLIDLGMSETEVWNKPSEGTFTIVAKMPETGIGDARWQ